MKIFNTIFSNARRLASKLPRQKQNTIADDLLPAVDTFVQGKKAASGTATLTPYRRKTPIPFTAKQYHKAGNIDEAKQYAQDVLGVKNFDIDDLELANQVNLSITRAYNKTKGKIAPPENVIYTTRFSAGNSAYGKDVIPMQMSSFCQSNSLKCTENTLEINKEYFNNIDKKIQGLLDTYAKNGQLSKNSKNLDQIELITSYHYDKTLNRYYRLYKQGKLTPKAKVDFENLLTTAREQEHYLLLQRKQLTEYLSKKSGVNLENLTRYEFDEMATKHLLQLRRNNKTLLDNNMLQTRNAIGVDGLVYHELGHSWHSKTVNFEDYEKCFAPYEALADKITSIKVSKYAAENGAETVGDIVKGVLSGDKYSDDVMQLGNQLTNGKLQFLC